VDLRRAHCERSARVDHWRRFLDFKIDPLSHVLSRRRTGRDYGCDRFTDKTDDSRSEHRLADRPVVELVQHRYDRLHTFEVRGGDELCAVRGGDAANLASGDRAAHESQMMRGRQVSGEAAAPRD